MMASSDSKPGTIIKRATVSNEAILVGLLLLLGFGSFFFGRFNQNVFESGSMQLRQPFANGSLATLTTVENRTRSRRGSFNFGALNTEPTSESLQQVKPVTRVALLGERNSGTNYIENLLSGPLQKYGRPPGKAPHLYPFAANIPVFEFKHMFRHTLLNAAEVKEIQKRQDTLWLLIVRDPCEWAEAMYRTPWHLCPIQNSTKSCRESKEVGIADLKGISLGDFWQLPWRDSVEAQYSLLFTYASVFHLRAHKLRLMEQVIEAAGPRRVLIAHLKEVEANPTRFLLDMVQQFGLGVNIKKARNLRFSESQHKALCLTPMELKEANNLIDWNMEAKFGFGPLDCRVCEGPRQQRKKPRPPSSPDYRGSGVRKFPRRPAHD